MTYLLLYQRVKFVKAKNMAPNFTESSSSFCNRNSVKSTSTTCPTGHYCLELKQWEYTNDFEECMKNKKCKKQNGNDYTTCYVIPSTNSTDIKPVEQKPCTPHPPSKFLFESSYNCVGYVLTGTH